MNKTKIISGLAVISALCGMNAAAQITYQNGDMLAGFANGTISTSTYEVIVDLGPIANFQQPYATGPISFSGVASALDSVFGGDLSGVYWSVFGANDRSTLPYNSSVSQADPFTVWNTLARPNPNNQTAAPFIAGSSALQQLAVIDIKTIGGLTDPNQAGSGQIVNLSPNIVSVKTSLGGYSSMMFGPFSGNLQGDWTYNILNLGAGASDLYQSNPGNSLVQHALYLGNFVLSSGGDLTYHPVPEPSITAIMGGGLVCLLALRRLTKRN